MLCFPISVGRSQFEFEKNTNVKQVEQMRTMEMNLITMTKQAEKLRADVANAQRWAQGNVLILLMFYLLFMPIPFIFGL